MNANDDYFQHLRSSQTDHLNVLTKEAVDWILSISPKLRPHALAKQFPRIANQLAAVWKEPALFDAELREYFVSSRPGRQGFPEEVAVDLMNLRTHFLAHYVRVGAGWARIGLPKPAPAELPPPPPPLTEADLANDGLQAELDHYFPR